MGTDKPNDEFKARQLLNTPMPYPGQAPYDEETKGRAFHPPPPPMGIDNAPQAETSEVNQSRVPPVQTP